MGGCCTRCCSAIGSCFISTGQSLISCPKRCCWWSTCCVSKGGEDEVVDGETPVDAEKGERPESVQKLKVQRIQSFHNDQVRHHGNRIVMYDPEVLGSWATLWMFRGTIFQDIRIWQLVATQICITLMVATVLALVVHSPKKLNTARFQEIGLFLKVLIAFMLGMFLNNALARWWNIVVKVMELLCSMKKLVFVLRTTNCEASKVKSIKRLGILAIYVFIAEVESNWLSDEDSNDEWEQCFKKVRGRRLITKREELELREVPAGHGQSNRSSVVLTWIGSRLLTIHKEKSVSPPVYARLMLNANDADDQIALSKVLSTVQMPFMYTHMLTILVHTNNILAAVTMGLIIGTAVGELFEKQSEFERNSPRRDIYTSVQMIVGSTIISTFQPAIYQAFLQIAATLCYPFGRYGESWARIPVTKLVEDLEEQLEWMDECIEHDKKHQKVEEKVSNSDKGKGKHVEGEDEEEDAEGGGGDD